MNTILYKIYLVWIILFVPGLTYGQKQAFTKVTTVTYTNEEGTAYIKSQQHFDGLGRFRLQQTLGHSPLKKDMTTMVEYDKQGNISAEWLPAAYNFKNLEYTDASDIKDQVISLYGDNNPHTSHEYESSPLKRITTNYGQGSEWQSNKKGVKTSYFTNIAFTPHHDATIYTVEDQSFETIKINIGSRYQSSILRITQIEDEEGNISCTFRDRKDQVILRRRVLNGKNVDTYFIYDDFGRLRAVLPPLLLGNSTPSNIPILFTNQLAYLYKYDDKGRCIAKKLPGCDWIYYIYDKADQLIFTQDGEQRKRNEWTFTIPDALNRTVLKGVCYNQLNVTSDPLQQVCVKATWEKVNNSLKGYGISGVTLNSPYVLIANYYDNYEFMELADAALFKPETGTGYGEPYKDGYKGLLTGTLTGITSNKTSYITHTYFYDKFGRIVQIMDNNTYGSAEKEYIAYNFTGQPIKRKLVHENYIGEILTEFYEYFYDHAGRLLKKTHQLNEGNKVILEENKYNEQGLMVETKRGGNSTLTTTYSHNIRSWITNISNSHFRQDLSYMKNGNIQSINWEQANNKHTCNLQYDNLSRLINTNHTINNTSGYNTSYKYDLNGNITDLKRYGNRSDTEIGLIDDLFCSYKGNQLSTVRDRAEDFNYPGSMDFKDHNKGDNGYTFDANGRMIEDLNKGVSSIQYNYLSLPHILDIKNPVAEARNTYTYAADGTKLSIHKAWNPTPSEEPERGSAVNLSALTKSKKTDYVGNKVYEDGILKIILVDDGYYDWSEKKYYFYIKDYQGSNRIVADANGTIVQSVAYYPFGLVIGDHSGIDKQPYKFTGQEIDSDRGLHLYDYHARYYDAQLGRFTTMDPSAEKYYSVSPYAYCFSSPTNYVDPDGKDPSIDVKRLENGTYQIVGGKIDGDKNIYVVNDDLQRTGEVLGESLTEYSFFLEDGSPVINTVIRPNDRSGINFLNDEIVGGKPFILNYMLNAWKGRKYDFKTWCYINYDPKNTQLPYYYRGLLLSGAPGVDDRGVPVYGSARDVGNMGAGIVAGRFGLGWGIARFGFDGLETVQKLGTMKWHTEGLPTQQAERIGFEAGRQMHWINRLFNKSK